MESVRNNRSHSDDVKTGKNSTTALPSASSSCLHKLPLLTAVLNSPAASEQTHIRCMLEV